MTERRLAAILVADVVGYTRLISADESGTLMRLQTLRQEIIDPNIAKHSGRLFKTVGDGFLVEFASAVQAVACAVAIQDGVKAIADGLDESKRMQLRIGIHVGDVLVQGDDLMGDGVNIAARIEGIAEPGGVAISRAVHEQVRDRLDVAFDEKGEVSLKNIPRPLHVFAVAGRKGATAAPKEVALALALPDKPSIAVLPFQNMSGDPEQEYFADGMVEDIITALSRFKSLFVIARNSSFSYKGKSPDIRQVGRELGVRYVLEGSVRKSVNRVRLTGQLIDAATGTHLWADRFDGALEDVFELQDRMTGSVVAAIVPKLRTAEIERAQRKPPGSLQAYDLVLRALSHSYGLTREGLEEAVRLLRGAIAIDSTYALGFAQLARCSWYLVAQGWLDKDSPEVIDMLHLARTALALDGDDPEVLAIVAPLVCLPGGDFGGGMELLEKALNLNPNGADAFRTAGAMYSFAGDAKSAIASLMQADRLNPLEAGSFHNSGYILVHFVAGEHELVIESTGKSLRDRPNYGPALRYRAASLGLLGRREEGRQVVQRILEQVPDFTIARARKHIEYDMNNAFKVSGVADSFYEGLRRSGVPEG